MRTVSRCHSHAGLATVTAALSLLTGGALVPAAPRASASRVPHCGHHDARVAADATPLAGRTQQVALAGPRDYNRWGILALVCLDLTGDGRADMAVVFAGTSRCAAPPRITTGRPEPAARLQVPPRPLVSGRSCGFRAWSRASQCTAGLVAWPPLPRTIMPRPTTTGRLTFLEVSPGESLLNRFAKTPGARGLRSS